MTTPDRRAVESAGRRALGLTEAQADKIFYIQTSHIDDMRNVIEEATGVKL